MPEKFHRHSWRGDGREEEGVHGRDVDGTEVVDVAGEGHPWEAASLQVPLRVWLIAGGRLCVCKVGDAPALLLTEGGQPLCEGGEGDEEGDDVRRLGATLFELAGEEGVVGIVVVGAKVLRPFTSSPNRLPEAARRGKMRRAKGWVGDAVSSIAVQVWRSF